MLRLVVRGRVCFDRAVNRLFPLRVLPDQERQGLNFAEHGATTAVMELLREMDGHRRSGEFSQRASIEPHTEVGQIADQYNRVLDEVQTRSQQLVSATHEAIEARGQLETTVQELKQFNRLAVGRELRMVELKQHTNELAAALGRPLPYDLSFKDSQDIRTPQDVDP